MLPKKINICGIDIDVVIIDEGSAELENNCGCFYHGLGKIYISKQMSDSMKKTTLIHEAIEAINVICDIGLEHHQIVLIEAALNSSNLIKDFKP